MVSRVQVLLDGMERGVTTVAALYERDAARGDLSDELVYAAPDRPDLLHDASVVLRWLMRVEPLLQWIARRTTWGS